MQSLGTSDVVEIWRTLSSKRKALSEDNILVSLQVWELFQLTWVLALNYFILPRASPYLMLDFHVDIRNKSMLSFLISSLGAGSKYVILFKNRMKFMCAQLNISEPPSLSWNTSKVSLWFPLMHIWSIARVFYAQILTKLQASSAQAISMMFPSVERPFCGRFCGTDRKMGSS